MPKFFPPVCQYEETNKRRDSKHEPNSLKISQSSKILAHGLDRRLVKIC